MTTTTQSQTDDNTNGSRVPVTGPDGACYLCEQHDATHVGYAALGPVSAHVGLCSDCWTLEYSDYETTIELDGTRNHRKITASDGSVAYTYETDEGTYVILEDGALLSNHATRSGPREDSHFEEASVAGGGTAEPVEPHELPAVLGEAVPIPEHTDVTVACPDCGTLRTVTYGALRDHNDRAHDGERIAKPVDDFTASDLPNMNRVRNPEKWTGAFDGWITDSGELVHTTLHDDSDSDPNNNP